MRSYLVGLTAIALGFSPPSFAQGSKASSAIEFARQAEALKPGQWVWAPEIAPEGPMTVYVDLSRQQAAIYRNGVRIGVSTVSSGKPGHETPTGVFTLLQKDAKHRSSTYNNAPMPFQQRLTWDGVALHAGGLPGYPESHGCIHLPFEFARLLFGETHMGGTVIVAGRAGHPSLTHSAGVPGHAGEMGQPIDAAILNQLRLPHEFYQRLSEIIVPGTTILVTEAPVLPQNSGKPMTIIASADQN